MRPLSPRTIRLRETMESFSAAALRNVPEPDLSALRAEVRQLRGMLGRAGSGAGAATDRLREQVSQFRRTGRLPDVRAARLVCWGTTLRDPQASALIEDPDRFPNLIHEVDSFRDLRRPYRRCWRGLLDGYVRYDPTDAVEPGRRNWTMLREYLNDNLLSLERSGSPPDWLATIDEHPNLLGERPCDRYGSALLEGDQEVLEPLRQDLGVGDSSWLMRQIFDAQIDAAVAYDDARLGRVMPRVIDLISGHDLLADGALARMLDRYAACAGAEVEPALRDLSVARWGNPWLERNDTLWTGVGDAARQMVSSWLKLSLIEKFFSLLSEDRLNDQRRVAFWKSYVDRIDDMHFALGETAYKNPTPDFRSLRKAMAGRLLRLDDAGTTRNNAFVMRMGGRIFVEFGEKGNAMFAFDAVDAPFDLKRPSISGNRTALKHPTHLARMIHTDVGGQRWERKIERRIAELLGRPPSRAVGPLQLPVPRPVEPLSVAAPSWVRSPPPIDRTISGAPEIAAVIASHSIKSVDLRDKGGSLWAYAPEGGPASADLRAHGFRWSERRGAWYLQS
ncbi:hypothetical protein BH09PSE3_BH09PSE3_12300 [soil metagenome]